MKYGPADKLDDRIVRRACYAVVRAALPGPLPLRRSRGDPRSSLPR